MTLRVRLAIPLLAVWACNNTAEGPDIPLYPAPLIQGQAATPSLAATLPPSHPPIDGAPPINSRDARDQPNPDVVAELGPVSATWTAPASWSSQPPSTNMRLAQWGLPGAPPDEPAECALFSFSGGGDVDSNINRWAGQFQQPDGSDSTAHLVREQSLTHGLPVTAVWLTGTFLSRDPPMSGPEVARPRYALLGAIVETATGPLFLKCTGPQAVMEAERPQFDAFVQSFTPAGAP